MSTNIVMEARKAKKKDKVNVNLLSSLLEIGPANKKAMADKPDTD